MADLTENNGGMGIPMTREEELTLALENSRKAHEEQQATLIDALHRHGVQIVVETNGSLVMVEYDTPKIVISAPPSYNQCPPPSTYDPLPRTIPFQSFSVSQAIRVPSPSAPHIRPSYVHYQ